MFGIKENEFDEIVKEPEEPKMEKTEINRSLLITPEQIRELSDMLNKVNSIGFDMAIQIENNELYLKFKNDLISINSSEFPCRSTLDMPSGPQASENVSKFAKTYLPSEEIKKMQRKILDNNEALTSQNVKNIEDTVANTVKAIGALAKVLSSMPAKKKDIDETMPLQVNH